jgi:hypothetical protein
VGSLELCLQDEWFPREQANLRLFQYSLCNSNNWCVMLDASVAKLACQNNKVHSVYYLHLESWLAYGSVLLMMCWFRRNNPSATLRRRTGWRLVMYFLFLRGVSNVLPPPKSNKHIVWNFYVEIWYIVEGNDPPHCYFEVWSFMWFLISSCFPYKNLVKDFLKRVISAVFFSKCGIFNRAITSRSTAFLSTFCLPQLCFLLLLNCVSP